MLIYNFTYTKANGDVSKRVLASLVAPSKFHAGTDITELSTEDQAIYITMVDAAKTAYITKLAEINQEFDLVHNYRQFNPEQMTDVKYEDI